MLRSRIVRVAGRYGLFPLARRLRRNTPRILMYHRFAATPSPGVVSRAAFHAQIEYIARHYTPVTMEELSIGLEDPARLPLNAVAITVDDGYQDFHEVALPILSRFRVPATLYVTTGFVAGRNWLWPDQVAWVLEQTDSLRREVEAGSFYAQPGLVASRREALWAGIVTALLRMPDAQLREWVSGFAASEGLTFPQRPPAHFSPIGWEALREAEAAGVEIGVHTVTHPSLGRVDRRQMRAEILGSVVEVDEHLGRRPRAFCYPNGRPQDCPIEAASLLSEAGCRSAVVAYFDREGLRHRYALRRHAVSDDQFQFMKAVSGVEAIGSALLGTTNAEAVLA